MNGLPNDMAKNGLLVIRDFYEDSKFWRKLLQIWEEYMKGLNKILNEMTNKATLTITEFSKKANFCPKWLIWQKLIKCLAKTHKWVDKKKACEKPGPVEIEPRVVPDLMVLKWQRNIWQWTWHCYQEKTKHFYCRWRKYILWLKYFHQCIEMELPN